MRRCDTLLILETQEHCISQMEISLNSHRTTISNLSQKLIESKIRSFTTMEADLQED